MVVSTVSVIQARRFSSDFASYLELEKESSNGSRISRDISNTMGWNPYSHIDSKSYCYDEIFWVLYYQGQNLVFSVRLCLQ